MLQKFLEVQPELLTPDGFNECLRGLWLRNGQWVALYSASAIVEKLSKEMPEMDAIEYFEYNIQGAYAGPMTPVFVWDEDPWGDVKEEQA